MPAAFDRMVDKIWDTMKGKQIQEQKNLLKKGSNSL